MTLIPIGRKLATADARPLGRDAVTDAVLAVKHHRDSITPDLIAGLRDVGPVHADIVVTRSQWIDDRPQLDFEVEDYRPLDVVPSQLYRYADTAAGAWWSGTKFDAWRGRGRHNSPSMFEVDSSDFDVLASFRCKFGRQHAPTEFFTGPSLIWIQCQKRSSDERAERIDRPA